MKKALIISIIIFVIIACVALHIVLNKGHVGTYALVQIDDAQKEEEVIQPKLILELEQDYLLSTKKKETVPIKVSIEGEGEVLLENVELESSDEEVVKTADSKAVCMYTVIVAVSAIMCMTAVFYGNKREIKSKEN